MMSYFTTHLSFTLLVKELLRLVNIWQSYRQNGWLCYTPYSPCTFVLKDADKLNNLCITDRNCYWVLLCYGRLMWVNYQEISIAVDQFWLTDWQTEAVSDWPTSDHVRHFAETAFLCCSSCVQWVMGFFIWPI